MIPIAVACIAFGGVFGAFDVSLVGWAELSERPWLAGPAFSALAVAIAIGSVITGARTWKLSPAARYILFAVLACAVALALPFAQGSAPLLFGVILILGLALSPVMVSGILVASARAPEGRVTETLAYPTAAMSLGVPIGGVIAGAALDSTGPAAALVTHRGLAGVRGGDRRGRRSAASDRAASLTSRASVNGRALHPGGAAPRCGRRRRAGRASRAGGRPRASEREREG